MKVMTDQERDYFEKRDLEERIAQLEAALRATESLAKQTADSQAYVLKELRKERDALRAENERLLGLVERCVEWFEGAVVAGSIPADHSLLTGLRAALGTSEGGKQG